MIDTTLYEIRVQTLLRTHADVFQRLDEAAIARRLAAAEPAPLRLVAVPAPAAPRPRRPRQMALPLRLVLRR